MGQKSSIEWTEATWNPVTGCSKVSPGCKHCYAERMAMRLKAMGQKNYANGFAVTLQEQSLELPLKWKRPQVIFVNSMSDLFHESVPIEFIKRVFQVMKSAHWHCFQVLTKRAERLLELSTELDWAPNIWMGVSIESDDYCGRAELLKQTGANIKFLSLEPLLGPLPSLSYQGLDWVIVGGESGPGSRPMEEGWVLDIRERCREFGVPFFFKQWGGTNKKAAGRLLQGGTYSEMPNLGSPKSEPGVSRPLF